MFPQPRLSFTADTPTCIGHSCRLAMSLVDVSLVIIQPAVAADVLQHMRDSYVAPQAS